MEIFNTVKDIVSSGIDKAKGLLSSTSTPVPGTPAAGEAQVFIPGSSTPVSGPAQVFVPSNRNQIIGQVNRQAILRSGGLDPNAPSSALPDYTFSTMEYPLGLSDPLSDQCGPAMIITAFEYKRSTNRAPTRFTSPTNPSIQNNNTEVKFRIMLPLPGNLRSSVASEFSSVSSMINAITQANTDTDILSQLKGDAATLYNQAKADFGDMDKMAGVAAASVLETTKGLLTGKSIMGSIAGAADSALKQASIGFGLSLNPMTEAAYVAPAIGAHQFDFTMVPKNEAEVIEIQQIIRYLREFSTGASALESTSLILQYPVIFNIQFVINVNGRFQSVVGIPIIPDCFLREMDVVFNPIGHGRLMADGSPVSYKMSLSFTNMRALTRSDHTALDTSKKGIVKTDVAPEGIDFFRRLFD